MHMRRAAIMLGYSYNLQRTTSGSPHLASLLAQHVFTWADVV